MDNKSKPSPPCGDAKYRPFYCVRQRAGPLVKECRALRPRLSADDAPWERREKADIIKAYRSSVCKSPIDRLELHIAVMGWDAWHHVLTFDPQHEPHTFQEVMDCWMSFYRKAKYWHGGKPYDWVRRVEGLHGNHRYHIHAVMRYSDFSPAEVQHLWEPLGMVVESTPVLKVRIVKDRRSGQPARILERNFRDLAEYLSKERNDGIIVPTGRHAQSWSRSLHAQLPPVEKWKAEDSRIEIPDGLIWRNGPYGRDNQFGSYYYMDYIEDKTELLF